MPDGPPAPGLGIADGARHGTPVFATSPDLHFTK